MKQSERKKLFSGMKEWDVLGDTRVVEPLDTNLKLDLHNYSSVKSIRLDGERRLVFSFVGAPYENSLEPLDEEWQFELIFHNATLEHVEPKDFLPYSGNHDMDDFIYEVDEQKGTGHWKWFGDTNSAKADPEIEFWADRIDYRRVK